MANTKFQQRLILSLCLGPLAFSACATLSGAKGGTGTAETAAVQERNKALDQLVVETLKPCAVKGKPQDNGLILVTAKADGTISPGAMQWLGSDEMKQCIVQEVAKAKLPPWKGPQVSWIWAVGTKDSPAPKALPEAPASYKEKERDQVQRVQGNTGSGNDTSVGELAACARQTIGQEVYAMLTFRLFIFPDGKVAGATPISNDGEGKDSAYMDCAGDMLRTFTFDPFPGPAFTTLDVPLKFGVNPSEK